MTSLICLANSWKRGERCIAGINPLTGEWVRPVSSLPDGQIPKEMRLIDRREPALLEILEIPLAEEGPDFGFERENLSVLPGKWRRCGRISLADLEGYVQDSPYILHNNSKYVTVSYLQSLPPQERQTLQLVKAAIFTVKSVKQRFEGAAQWEGTLLTYGGQCLTTTITDPVFVQRLEWGYVPQNPCLITVSLSMPWRPSDWEEEDSPCWKLIAAVMELPDPANVDDIPF